MEQQADALRDTPIEFTASGREYFGIWIVNILLTVITLGVYSAWAKVRTRKYFYNNTRIDGAVFDYHANPVAILKGWLIVVVLLIIQQGLMQTYPLYGLGMLLLMLSLVPWAMVRSRAFNLMNTSYRNVRLHFDRNYKGMYGILLFAPVPIIIGYAMLMFVSIQSQLQGNKPAAGLMGIAFLIIFVGMILMPYFTYRFYRFVINHSSYGKSYFVSHITAGRFYVIYLQAFGLGLLLGLVIMLFMFMGAGVLQGGEDSARGIGGIVMGVLVFLIYIFGLYYVAYFIQAKKLNEIWGKTTIAGHRFTSQLTPLGYTWVMLLNTLLIIITLGLYVPWAKVRIARYRLDNIVLQVQGELDNFAAKEAEQIGALGMEFGEAMDFVISL